MSWPTKKSNFVIPIAKRDAALITRLFPVIICGFDNVLNQEGKLYLRLLCRLVDKVFDEYSSAREYLLEEIKSKDKLAHRFNVINHLEDCINALNRAIAVFHSTQGHSDLGRIVSKITKRKLQKLDVSALRNTVEHIDKDIYNGLCQKGLFLDIDDEYKNICINDKCVSLSDLVVMIEQYHRFVLEIFAGLPNRWEGGKYYYDRK